MTDGNDFTRGDIVLSGADLLAISDRLDEDAKQRGDERLAQLTGIPIVQVDDGVLEPMQYRMVFDMELGGLVQIEVAGEIGYTLFKHRVRDAMRKVAEG